MAKRRTIVADALRVGDHTVDATMLLQALSGIIAFAVTDDWPIEEVRAELKDELFNVKVAIDGMLAGTETETAVDEWSKGEGG